MNNRKYTIGLWPLLALALTLAACSEADPYGEQRTEGYTLQVEQPSVTLDIKHQGSVQVVASPELSWKVYSAPEWVSIQDGNNSFKGSAKLSLSADDNPETSSRQGTVALRSMRYHYTAQLSVTQPGSYIKLDKQSLDFLNTGGSFPVSVEANTRWELSVPQWIVPSVYGGEAGTTVVNFTANPNQEELTHKGVIKFSGMKTKASASINATQSEVVFKVSHTELSFPTDGSSQKITVEASSTWTSRVDGGTWCHVSPDKGNAGTTTVTVTADRNSQISDRQATITLQCGKATRTIKVKQTQKDYLGDFSNIKFDKIQKDSRTINVSCNTKWTVMSEYPAWCTVTPSEGSLNGTFTVSVEQNNTDAPRSAIITVKAGTEKKTFTVTQHGEPSLTVSSSSLEFFFEGGNKSFDITSNTDWTITASDSWCKPSETAGKDSKTITVTVGNYSGKNERTAVITVKSVKNNNLKRDISVKQYADSYLEIGEKTITLSKSKQTRPLELKSNAVWTATVTKGSDWCEVTPKRGVGDKSVNITVSENPTDDKREATIDFITDDKKQKVTVTVVQQGEPTITLMNTPQGAIDHNYQTVKFTINSNTAWTASSGNAGWLAIEPESGSGTKEVTLRVGTNKGDDERSATITVSSVKQSSVKQQFVLSQKAEEKISLSPSVINDVSYEGGEVQVTVTTNLAWEITNNTGSSWCHPNKNMGNKGKPTVVFTVDKKDDPGSRKAEIVFTAGSKTVTLYINQNGAPPTLTISPNQTLYEVPADGKTYEISVSSNTQWKVEHNVTTGTWLQLNPSTGNRNGYFRIIIGANGTKDARSAKVTISNGSKSYIITFNQEGVIFHISNETVVFESEGGTKTVSFTSNSTVKFLRSSETWCSATVLGSQLSITTGKNDNSKDRSATVFIKAANLEIPIQVQQKGKSSIDLNDYSDDTNLN